MRASASLLLAPLLLLGCAGDGDEDPDDVVDGEVSYPADGIWLLRAQHNDDDSCTENFDHNFDDSYTADEGPWTETDLLDYSDSLALVQISVTSPDFAVLVSGTEIWPGTPTDGGWLFEWVATDSEQTSREHEEGYQYQELIDRSETSSLRVSIDGDTATGTWTFGSEEDITLRESDRWDVEVGMSVGDIPSADYLSYDDGDVEGIPRSNTIDETECSDALCELRFANTCSGTATVTLTRTGYDEEAAYDQLEGVAHPFGTGS